jgi:hypothetical protein
MLQGSTQAGSIVISVPEGGMRELSVRSPMKSSLRRSSIRVVANTDQSDRALHEIYSSDRDVRKEKSLAAAKRIVTRTLLRGAGFLLVMSLPVFMLWMDVSWLDNAVGEVSATELSQLSCLVLIMIGFGYLARLSPEDRRFAVLTAGFFACMLIRELDAALDLIVDGLWQVLVFLVVVACLTYAISDWRATLRGMARMMATRFALVMTVGLALLLSYSRLLGMGLLWKEMLHEGYIRAIKNAAEESAELLGYVLILVAAIGYVGSRRLRLSRSRTRSVRA